MAGRFVAVASTAIVSSALIGCGVGTEPQPGSASDAGTALVAATEVERTLRLTDLAEDAVEQLRADANAGYPGIAGAEPETWWVTIEVDVPLSPDDFDDPLASIPEPLDTLRTAIVQLRVIADAPVGMVGAQLTPPFDGLRTELDGSKQIVTTVPGDEPPSTDTWDVTNSRITRLALTVADFDAMAVPQTIADLGPEKFRLGPPGGATVLTVAQAADGVPATHPPLTGTTLPRPRDITGESPGTPSTTQPDRPAG